MKTNCAVVIILMLACLSMRAQDAPVTLHVMDPTPPFHPLKWLKGTPIEKLTDDQIYVLDFTAVYCPACRTSIPHLSKLKQEYEGKVKFAAIYVFENDETDTVSTYYSKRVQEFINGLDEKIKYDVAIDDPKRTMLRTWMNSAGQYGVPTAYVIKQNKIIWIGGVFELDRILPQIVSGTFDPIAAHQTQQVIAARQPLWTEIKKGNYKRVMEMYDSMIRITPNKSLLYSFKFKYYLELNEEEAYAFGYRLLENECKNSEGALKELGLFLEQHNSGLSSKHPNWTLAIAFWERCLRLTDDEFDRSMIHDMIAKFKYDDHKYAEAVKTQNLALAEISALDQKDFRISQYKKFFLEAAELYKSKLGK